VDSFEYPDVTHMLGISWRATSSDDWVLTGNRLWLSESLTMSECCWAYLRVCWHMRTNISIETWKRVLKPHIWPLQSNAKSAPMATIRAIMIETTGIYIYVLGDFIWASVRRSLNSYLYLMVSMYRWYVMTIPRDCSRFYQVIPRYPISTRFGRLICLITISLAWISGGLEPSLFSWYRFASQ
jgi:hypothetical protein